MFIHKKVEIESDEITDPESEYNLNLKALLKQKFRKEPPKFLPEFLNFEENIVLNRVQGRLEIKIKAAQLIDLTDCDHHNTMKNLGF